MMDSSSVDKEANNDAESTAHVPLIRMVIQRYRRASLLIDECHVVTVGGPTVLTASSGSLLLSPQGFISSSSDSYGSNNNTNKNVYVGMLVYISFSKSATTIVVERAAKTILNAPIQTEGSWGDSSSTRSMLQLLQSHYDRSRLSSNTAPSPISILLVPQANLIAKVKKNGKSIQYRDQIDKDRGRELYEKFVKDVELLLLEHYNACMGAGTSTDRSPSIKQVPTRSTESSTSLDPSIPPLELFQYHPNFANVYGTFNEATGFPLTTRNGEELTKSARKKLQKIYDAHVKRHEKYLEAIIGSQNEDENTTKRPTDDSDDLVDEGQSKRTTSLSTSARQPDDLAAPLESNNVRLDPSFVQLIAGTFGKRQGLEICSDMGPFCHVIEID